MNPWKYMKNHNTVLFNGNKVLAETKDFVIIKEISEPEYLSRPKDSQTWKGYKKKMNFQFSNLSTKGFLKKLYNKEGLAMVALWMNPSRKNQIGNLVLMVSSDDLPFLTTLSEPVPKNDIPSKMKSKVSKDIL